MFPENTDRNRVIYELWTKGCTIDEISSDTDIPRSTVGYYVRKFNTCARKGTPIVFQRLDNTDTKDKASRAVDKTAFPLYETLSKFLKDKDEIDKMYKILMIVKLIKELQRDLFPTKEEIEAVFDPKNASFVFDKVMQAVKIKNMMK